MMQTSVLVIDDEQPIRDMICFALRQPDFICRHAESAEQAYARICSERPDIILLDWMLPAASGIDFARMLRTRELYRDIPIIMLTARGEENDKLKGFGAGCDDYITKPFSTRELAARIRAVLKRTRSQKSREILTIAQLTLESDNHRVLVGDTEIHLGPREFDLLKFLMAHTERVYSRAQLLDHIWGEASYIEERTIDVHMFRLRKALKPYKLGQLIQTVRGAGYRLSALKERPA